jgi:hypothetical protein
MVREDTAGEKRLVAYVTLRGGADVTSDELRAHTKAALPDHMVPSAFIVLEQMPLTPSGKLNRRALPELDRDACISGKHYEAPQGPLESAVAAIWSGLLTVTQVGRRDDFFELGGHSLLAMQALARIQAALSIEIPIRMLFEHPTLEQLCSRMDEVRRARLLETLSQDDTDLLGMLTSMTESEAQDLLRQTRAEPRI